MDMDHLLLSRNGIRTNPKRIKIVNNWIPYQNRKEDFNGLSIKDLMIFINTFKHKYPGINIPVYLDLGDIVFRDKLTYIFLELLCYILITQYHHVVKINFNCTGNIFTEGISSSPLWILKSNAPDLKKFCSSFSDDIYMNHYRKVLHRGNDQAELSRKMDEISYFLKNLDIEPKCIDELSEVIAELIGNSWEHASVDCLVDVDVTTPYAISEDDSGDQYIGVNLAVLNFSEKLLGTALKNRIMDDELLLPERYLFVKKAYEYHAGFFDKNYTEADFFNIASFQHKISGRKDKEATGGTGLTKLISSLEKRAKSHNCYLISGDRALWFFPEYLEYNAGWIGFNKEREFLQNIPAMNIIGSNLIYMPGTAYNLNFALKRST